MTARLLKATWTDLDSAELQLLLRKHMGPGQYDSRATNPDKLYLPLAGTTCRLELVFRDDKIDVINPGPAFDAQQWRQIGEEIEKSLLPGPLKVGREYSFSGRRVRGSWRGEHSGVQLLPPPKDAPLAPVENADHPFILEFPVKESDFREINQHRRIREHRKLTLLLNLLLAGRIDLPPRQSRHFWTYIPCDGGDGESKWVQEFFFAPLGDVISDKLSPYAETRLEQVEPEEYYAQISDDRTELRIPTDLDESICFYLRLSPTNRAKLDRALFWLNVAARQWTFSVSSSFASLVSAVESLTDRGTTHHLYCEKCKSDCRHEVPGATERFRAFFEQYAPGTTLRKRRTQMYSLRSGILHGSDLMQFDQDCAFGCDLPGWWNERELHGELWSVTRIAMRHWLRNQ
jgi:hypothetical protein